MTVTLPAPSEVRLERRRHRVVVTHHTEYHFRDDLCVMVRETKKSGWDMAHSARGRRLAGQVKWARSGVSVVREHPIEPGSCLYFADESGELLTSRIVRVERPARRLVEQYPAEE
jgi:hypothetical protein